MSAKRRLELSSNGAQKSLEGTADGPPPKTAKTNQVIALVASDGGTFGVEACRLWGASDVLRDAWACTHPTPTVITFDDGAIEYSKVLGLFSRYVKGQQIELPTTWSQLCDLQALLEFTDKWGCLSVQQHVLSDLHRSLLLGKYGSTNLLFRLAAKYDDVEFAKTIISRPHWRCRATPNWSYLQKEVAGRDALDLRTWDMNELADVPSEYRWALDRATLNIDWKAKDNDWKQVAKRFEQFLQIAQKK